VEGLEDYQSVSPKNSPIGSSLLEDLYEILDDDLFMDLRDVMYVIVTNMTVAERLDLIQYILHLQEVRRTLNFPDYPATDLSLLQLQSEDVESSSVEPGSHTASTTSIPGNTLDQVVVEYLDENPGVTIDFTPVADPSYYNDYLPSTELAKFLERPLRIQNITWTEGSTLNTTFQPWDNYFHATSVAKKLDNYAFISCNLHVKFVLNASPFYYGASIASYCPITDFNTDSINTNVSTNNGRQLIPMTQRPHIKIFPQTCQGGELVLPFFYYQNWLPVGTRSAFQNMGTISMNSFSTLQNAGVSAGSGVTISVYAWATDVRLMGATTNLALQSEDLDLQAKTEYSNPNHGIVSQPASAVANIASKLKNIPVIGPYAKATEMISSGVAAVASLFGFTDTPVVEAVCPLKNLPFPALASADISAPIDKLTLDPKQELSVDTRCCGLDGTDEMMISNIVMRESYLTQFNFTHSNVTDDLLFNLFVSPHLLDYETSGAPVTYVASTPLCHISNLFGYWRGDIIFRFRFICSKFHRGRVLIQWDPTGNIGTVANASNQVFTKIVDISESTDIEVCIPYVQATEWQYTRMFKDSSKYLSIDYGSNGTPIGPSYDSTVHNGYLSVKCLTVLTSPTSTSDIEVLVSVRGSDNVEFANPIVPPQQTTFFNLQSQDLVSYDEPEIVTAGEKSATTDTNSYLVYQGERFASLRSLLRRTSLTRINYNGADSTHQFLFFASTHAHVPLYRGYDPNGIESAVGTLVPGSNFNYNYNYVTPWNWLAYCYRGYRGSANWTYNFDSSNGAITHIKAQRFTSGRSSRAVYRNSTNIATGSTYSAVTKYFNDNIPLGSEGQSLMNGLTQNGLQIQAPMYSKFRFRSTDPLKITLGSNLDGTNVESIQVEYMLSPIANTTNCTSIALEQHFAIGTDFSFVFFLNVPTVIVLSTPTAN